MRKTVPFQRSVNNNARYRSGSVQDSVYSALRKSILNLNLAPGTVISETEISLHYKVSRTPVREAFINLAKEGLVRVIPQRETLVSRIDLNRVEQERFIRESLEMAVLEPFIEHYQSEDIANLEKLLDMQGAASDRNEYIGFMNLDETFHRIFFDVSGYALGGELLESMCGHYHRVRLLSSLLNGIAQNIISQHQDLISALKERDLLRARAVLTQHLHKLNTEKTLLRERFPDYFVSAQEEQAFEVDFGGIPLPGRGI
ncbi:MAG: GntR family transcriptional regulator [Spirochaetaceae bacterium]|nr:GntR family transcriptional regulator [Spirochaetaceae bacterium]